MCFRFFHHIIFWKDLKELRQDEDVQISVQSDIAFAIRDRNCIWLYEMFTFISAYFLFRFQKSLSFWIFTTRVITTTYCYKKCTNPLSFRIQDEISEILLSNSVSLQVQVHDLSLLCKWEFLAWQDVSFADSNFYKNKSYI